MPGSDTFSCCHYLLSIGSSGSIEALRRSYMKLEVTMSHGVQGISVQPFAQQTITAAA